MHKRGSQDGSDGEAERLSVCVLLPIRLFDGRNRCHGPRFDESRRKSICVFLTVTPNVTQRALFWVRSSFLTRFLQGNTGAAWVTRTPDPIITNDVLYRLS